MHTIYRDPDGSFAVTAPMGNTIEIFDTKEEAYALCSYLNGGDRPTQKAEGAAPKPKFISTEEPQQALAEYLSANFDFRSFLSLQPKDVQKSYENGFVAGYWFARMKDVSHDR